MDVLREFKELPSETSSVDDEDYLSLLRKEGLLPSQKEKELGKKSAPQSRNGKAQAALHPGFTQGATQKHSEDPLTKSSMVAGAGRVPRGTAVNTFSRNIADTVSTLMCYNRQPAGGPRPSEDAGKEKGKKTGDETDTRTATQVRDFEAEIAKELGPSPPNDLKDVQLQLQQHVSNLLVIVGKEITEKTVDANQLYQVSLPTDFV
jgi:hypothetical protein